MEKAREEKHAERKQKEKRRRKNCKAIQKTMQIQNVPVFKEKVWKNFLKK